MKDLVMYPGECNLKTMSCRGEYFLGQASRGMARTGHGLCKVILRYIPVIVENWRDRNTQNDNDPVVILGHVNYPDF